MKSAVQSVLTQPKCLELLVADGGSTDGSLKALETMAGADHRLRIVSRSDAGPADALNKAFLAARGTLIGWLNADDLSPPGAFARAVTALAEIPEWLMVYGEGEQFNEETGLIQRYPTLPPSMGLSGFQSHCFICQPAVVFRRPMGVLLGEFDQQWRTAFDFDYRLRAFEALFSSQWLHPSFARSNAFAQCHDHRQATIPSSAGCHAIAGSPLRRCSC